MPKFDTHKYYKVTVNATGHSFRSLSVVDACVQVKASFPLLKDIFLLKDMLICVTTGTCCFISMIVKLYNDMYSFEALKCVIGCQSVI